MRGNGPGPVQLPDDGTHFDEFASSHSEHRDGAFSLNPERAGYVDGSPRFSEDAAWMPRLVLIAKQTYVWLAQLSRQYGRSIVRLDEIPEEELQRLAQLGFTGLWLIGLWERSPASRNIKVRCGNPEAESSAYSLRSYDVAERLGGTEALDRLLERARRHGLRPRCGHGPQPHGDGQPLDGRSPRLVRSTPVSPFPTTDSTDPTSLAIPGSRFTSKTATGRRAMPPSCSSMLTSAPIKCASFITATTAHRCRGTTQHSSTTSSPKSERPSSRPFSASPVNSRSSASMRP